MCLTVGSVKTVRSQAYLAMEQKLSSSTDVEGIVLMLNTDAKHVIDQVLALKAVADSTGRELVSLNLDYAQVEFLVPTGGTLLFSESIYFFEPLLRSLDFDDFFFVLTCLMLEKSVIFVSTSMQRLCSSM